MQSMTDWQRIDSMMDEDIDLSDIPELDDSFFREATLVLPKPKAVVTLRVDADVQVSRSAAVLYVPVP
jgi:uncharacterized protein (DUF4415 family)